jgi:hypothetical protein
MAEASGPKPPTNLAMRLDPDVAEILHRLAYETGKSKRDLVHDAVRKTYKTGEDPKP